MQVLKAESAQWATQPLCCALHSTYIYGNAAPNKVHRHRASARRQTPSTYLVTIILLHHTKMQVIFALAVSTAPCRIEVIAACANHSSPHMLPSALISRSVYGNAAQRALTALCGVALVILFSPATPDNFRSSGDWRKQNIFLNCI